MKKFVRRLPPLARRDAQLREYRAQNKRLRLKVKRLHGSAPEPKPVLAHGDVMLLIARSGLFDERWYVTQLHEPLDDAVDPLEHYVTVGAKEGLWPHPAFVPSYYLQQTGVRHGRLRKIEAAPLLHYLTEGVGQPHSPHPMFDAAAYLEQHPESAQHPGGPLGHLLSGAGDGPVTGPAHADPWLDPDFMLAASTQAAEKVRDSRGYWHLERDQPDFDLEAERALKETLLEHSASLIDGPRVSIILPTKDRREALQVAVDSVLAQSYQHWQLVIVDDGSRDETEAALQRYLGDERITYVRHPESRGVSAARNTGLAHATGDYVAYLDSDNSWLPDFLQLMLLFMRRDGHRVAYAMSALVEEEGEGRRLYRGMPYSHEALKERNYIDCIVLVHERSLLEETGTFDEGLRRNVDWDLFIRLAQVTDFGFVPFIATQYDVWETRTERITSDEPMGYRYVVRQRSLVDWDALRSAADQRRHDVLSVVLVATGTAATVLTAVQRLRHTALGKVEVVVVDSRLPDGEAVALQCALGADPDVTIVRLTHALPLETSRNIGAGRTSGGVIAFLPETAWCEPGWDTDLLAALEHHTVVQPLVLSPGGSVWSAGVSFMSNGRGVLSYRRFAGDAPEVRGTRTVDAASAICVATRAGDYLAVEGFDPIYVGHYSGGDLSLRLTHHTGGTAACVGSSMVALLTEPPAPTKANTLMTARDNERRLRDLVRSLALAGDPAAGHDGYEVHGFAPTANVELDPTPILIRQRPDRPLRWAIKMGPPNVQRRTNWGDWHFALSLRDSLERLGHEVSIDCKEDWYRPTAYLDDVVLVLRGVSVYEVNPGHTNISWVISHPERVTAREMSDYDLVFGASPRWCERVRPRLHPPVEVLLQCTDQRRFRPVEPDRRRAYPVLAVANARGVRPSVAAALESGIVPSVYGVRWDNLLPEGAWKGEYLPNEELPSVYAAAGVVLNDHWDDMREHGLLSNRLFDLAACNARVISDHMPEIDHVFGDVISTFTTAADLPLLVDQHLHEHPERQAAREQLGEVVRRAHTFDARARTLSERVLQLRAGSPEPARAK